MRIEHRLRAATQTAILNLLVKKGVFTNEEFQAEVKEEVKPMDLDVMLKTMNEESVEEERQ